MIRSKKTRAVKVGSVIIGGGFPVSVQTMWNEPLSDNLEIIKARLNNLMEMGCDICRFSVSDETVAERLNSLSLISPIPLVADIHFDHKLALKCMDSKIAKIRINPGNIGAEWKVKEVLKKAADKELPIRIGINGGSLPSALRGERDKAGAMLKAAEIELEILSRLDFHNVIFSLKSSDLEDTVRANLKFASLCDYPVHLGVTEAGALIPGVVKSSIAFSRLLNEGVGDTIRVSLSDSPEREIHAGREILRACGCGLGGVNIISCPRCGRTTFDGEYEFLEKISNYSMTVKKDVTIAVMGCVVNGPEEAKAADLGISGVGNKVIIYKNGKILKKTDAAGAYSAFIREIDTL